MLKNWTEEDIYLIKERAEKMKKAGSIAKALFIFAILPALFLGIGIASVSQSFVEKSVIIILIADFCKVLLGINIIAILIFIPKQMSIKFEKLGLVLLDLVILEMSIAPFFTIILTSMAYKLDYVPIIVAVILIIIILITMLIMTIRAYKRVECGEMRIGGLGLFGEKSSSKLKYIMAPAAGVAPLIFGLGRIAALDGQQSSQVIILLISGSVLGFMMAYVYPMYVMFLICKFKNTSFTVYAG